MLSVFNKVFLLLSLKLGPLGEISLMGFPMLCSFLLCTDMAAYGRSSLQISQDFFNRLWIVLMCLLMLAVDMDLVQKEHSMVSLLCTCLMCLLRLLIANSFSQCGQGFFILSCCSLMCLPRLSTLISFWHSLHWDFSPKWMLWMWLSNTFFFLKVLLQ